MSNATLALTPQKTFYVPGQVGKKNPTSPSDALQAAINKLLVDGKWFAPSAIKVDGAKDLFIMATQTTAANDLIANYKKKNPTTQFSYTLVYTSGTSASARSGIASGSVVQFLVATNSVADLMIKLPQLFSFVLVVAETKTKKVYYPAGWALSKAK